ncbi:MAG: hypothetical protein ACPGVD_08330 [Flavobacteriales bacterium]
MDISFKSFKTGVFSFIIVLLFMPLGHALMVFNEKMFPDYKFLGAAFIGFFGLFLFFIGIRKNDKPLTSTLLGLIAGILIWTGWVEFSFVWIAEKLEIAPLMENGEIATKPEYLVMMSSVGLLSTILILYFFKQSSCTFFQWFRKLGKMNLKKTTSQEKFWAGITFIETIVIIWTFYIVLLLVYDEDIAGDRHPLTYFVAFGSLFWSALLFLKLINIKKFDYAIRYAIPTVIIFWNFIEVIGRWDMFKEIWVHPFEHWIENSIILGLLILFIVYYIWENKKRTNEKRQLRIDKRLKENNLFGKEIK